jgi:hypothetical protein
VEYGGLAMIPNIRTRPIASGADSLGACAGGQQEEAHGQQADDT